MKRILTITIFLLTLGYSFGQHPLDRSNQTLDEFQQAEESFSRGEATNGERYYEGALAEVLIVESYLVSFVDMDEANAPIEDFNKTISDCLGQIKIAEKALGVYQKKDWPLREELHNVTMNWLNAVKILMTDHLIGLAEPLSRADETWGEEEFALYDEYLKEYEEYLKADQVWVDFQYKFAKANDFVIEGTVDTEAWEEEVAPSDSNEK